MNIQHKATRIDLFSFSTPQMRAFHMTWVAFFLCFFGWFGIAPLMPVVRNELALTQTQIGNTIIASVAITILARLLIGWFCDRVGPRLAYTLLLLLGSLPIMGIGLSTNYTTFLLFRLAIGMIGASFVITQYHTSVMFAPNVVGTANATTAGWGNLGGGVTQMVMPLIFAALLNLGLSEFYGWRIAMVVPGVALFLTGIAYYLLTTDTPDGNVRDLRARGQLPAARQTRGTFLEACKDCRVWALFGIYAACFGIELTLNNIAALYFTDYFGLSLSAAGLVASLFGLMNLFARTAGGFLSDKVSAGNGLRGRVQFLFLVLLAEGIALAAFSQMAVLPAAIATLLIFSLFVQMAEGATYAVVPFINKRALGSVAGIVGAGGNAGAVLFGFLFRIEGLAWPQALMLLGIGVALASLLAFLVRFSEQDEQAVVAETSGYLTGGQAAGSITLD
ncbi:MAG TPA: MFS transporter [Caldilineaceae bacterium]|nr:MFS transporter [Caldilineaceae bacterium]